MVFGSGERAKRGTHDDDHLPGLHRLAAPVFAELESHRAQVNG
jgi:hypothetical protein